MDSPTWVEYMFGRDGYILRRFLGVRNGQSEYIPNEKVRTDGRKFFGRIGRQNFRTDILRSAGFGKKTAGGIRNKKNQPAGGIREKISAGGIQEQIRPAGGIRKTIFGRKKRSVAQIKDQVMTIKTHTESSKSELSSGTFDPVKV